MLVYYRFPRGSTVIDNQRVYGFLEKFPPARISWGSYKANKHDLILASYTKEILESMFPGSTFPDINFTYAEIIHLDWEQLCGLCKGFGITTSRQNRLRRRSIVKFMKEYC